MPEFHNRKNILIWLLCIAAFCLLAVSLVAPEFWWGIHWFSFLSSGSKLLFLILAILPIGVFFFAHEVKKKIAQQFSRKVVKRMLLGIIVVSGIGMFYNFPIVMDMYGNAHQYVGFRDQVFTEFPEKPINELLKFELVPSGGRKTVLHSYTILSYLTGLKYKTIFKGAGLVFGGLFLCLWIWFVCQQVSKPSWQIILSFIGVFAPFTQIFYDHTETYPPCFLLAFVWLVSLLFQIKKRSTVLLWLLVPLYLLSVKLHPVTLLLGPALLLALIHHYFKRIAQWIFTWRGLVIAGLMPIFMLGAVLYFFILKDYNDPRFLEGVTDAERVFLPLISPEPPLDRYNIQSLNHLFDYLNMMLHWSIPAWLVLISGIIIVGAKRLFESVEMKLMLLTTFLFAAFFFVFNPLLSMPID